MLLTFTVEVELEFRGGGPFASRDELATVVECELEGVALDEVEGEAGGSYEVTSWAVVREPGR